MPAKKTTKKKWETYQDYLDSREWLELRLKANHRSNMICERCGDDSGNVETHHWKYPKDWKDDSIENLITLCPICHKAMHAEKLCQSRDEYLTITNVKTRTDISAFSCANGLRRLIKQMMKHERDKRTFDTTLIIKQRKTTSDLHAAFALLTFAAAFEIRFDFIDEDGATIMVTC